jgi:ribonucleoside-diphosphate reductase beta chain
MELTREVLDLDFDGFAGRSAGLSEKPDWLLHHHGGIFFYTGFAMILKFHSQNLMKGIGEQFQYILRDETIT